MKNQAGRDIPQQIAGRTLRPYSGALEPSRDMNPVHTRRRAGSPSGGGSKLRSLEDAIRESGLRDGMTISFHHSFREGDQVIVQVMAAIRRAGIRDLRFAPSAVVDLRDADLSGYVQDGTITRIEASGIRGQLGDDLVSGKIQLKEPAILRPHGARPRAIEAGELEIDVAFIGASASDCAGNCTGQIGKNPCGSLGYSFVDAHNAEKVIVLTDTLVDYPCCPASISQQYVDYVVELPQIGDPARIGTGAARLTQNPRDLLIARQTAQVIAASRRFREGFSFQTGAGAIAIACTKFLGQHMEEAGIHASFALGGITASIIDLYDAGLVRVAACSQCFDAVAARAIVDRPGVVEIDNADYANAFNKGSYLEHLNFGILGALEVDRQFHVNILTGSSGQMMGGLGGGPDVASAADISIVALPIVRGRIPSVVDRVFTCSTPGNTVACVVTQAGIALNPAHPQYAELREDLERARIEVTTIDHLRELALSITGEPEPVPVSDRVVALVEYRDGTVLDVIRQVLPTEEETGETV